MKNLVVAFAVLAAVCFSTTDAEARRCGGRRGSCCFYTTCYTCVPAKPMCGTCVPNTPCANGACQPQGHAAGSASAVPPASAPAPVAAPVERPYDSAAPAGQK